MKKFISLLPELKSHEVYYLSLISRRKYSTSGLVISDKVGLKSFSSSKDTMFNKIKQLECSIGTYKDYKLNKEVEENTLALYIYLTPRNIKKANIIMAKALVENGFSDDSNLHNRNPIVWAKTYIAKSKSKTKFVGFDFDLSEESKPKWIEYFDKSIGDILNKESYFLIETRGGYHLIVELRKVDKNYSRSWHLNIMKLLGEVDISGDMMTPIPGGIQGGHTPKLIKYD